jgi:hypothetical protein
MITCSIVLAITRLFKEQVQRLTNAGLSGPELDRIIVAARFDKFILMGIAGQFWLN